jgi:hypothetical protein
MAVIPAEPGIQCFRLGCAHLDPRLRGDDEQGAPADVRNAFHLVFGAVAVYAGLAALAATHATRIDLVRRERSGDH